MLTIFYSPHATSVDNEAGRASGHADVPLSDLGYRQAKELGEHYRDQELAAVFCSDLQRAATTARLAFSERAIPIVLDARLREYNYGDMTQQPIALVEQEFLRRIDEPFPNGDSLFTIVQNIGTLLRRAIEGYDGRTIVVIGHRATRYGLEYWCGEKTLEQIVRTPWVWRDVPIWRYTPNIGRV